MKTKLFFACIVLLLGATGSHALTRYTPPAPILHTVLDLRPVQAASPAQHYLDFSLTDMPRTCREPVKTPPKTKHHIGVAMLILGSTFLAGGAALFIAGIREDQYQQSHPQSEGSGLIAKLFGVMLAIPGHALFIPGLFMSIKYRKNGSHPWNNNRV